MASRALTHAAGRIRSTAAIGWRRGVVAPPVGRRCPNPMSRSILALGSMAEGTAEYPKATAVLDLAADPLGVTVLFKASWIPVCTVEPARRVAVTTGVQGAAAAAAVKAALLPDAFMAKGTAEFPLLLALPSFPKIEPRASDPGQAKVLPRRALLMPTSEKLAQIGISSEEKDKLVAEVMRCVMFKTHQTSGCPIKREELTAIVTKNYRQRALPTLVINEALDRLASTFRYKMRELQRIRASTRSGRGSSQAQPNVDARSYILVSMLEPEVYRKYVQDKDSAHLSAFACIVVGIVQLAGGKMSEEDLWHQLKRLGLNEADGNDSAFGNNKQALEHLVRQRYLQKEKSAGPEGHFMMYELAERALDESISAQLKDYITQVGDKSTTAAEVD